MTLRLLPGLLLAALLAGCWPSGGTSTLPPTPQDPFSALDVYGTWYDVPAFGRVWHPTAPPEWAPFVDGQWIWTDRGWLWDPEEPFGWIVYHYGSWTRVNPWGWVWVPGYDWSPAPVAWIVGDDYVGWAPQGPPHTVLLLPGDPDGFLTWVFVPASSFVEHNVGRSRLTHGPPGMDVLRTTRPTGRTPDAEVIGRATGRGIDRKRIETEDFDRDGRRLKRVRALRPMTGRDDATAPPMAPAPLPPATLPGPPAKPTPAEPRERTPSRPDGGTRKAKEGKGEEEKVPTAPIPPPTPPPTSTGTVSPARQGQRTPPTAGVPRDTTSRREK